MVLFFTFYNYYYRSIWGILLGLEVSDIYWRRCESINQSVSWTASDLH